MMQLFNAENGKERQKTMRVLNFGSLNLDYVYTVDHFVMPGETISSTSRTIKHGGKGLNQSVARQGREPMWPMRAASGKATKASAISVTRPGAADSIPWRKEISAEEGKA